MAIIYIQDLKLRALIGTHPWERKNKQDIIFNIVIEYASEQACKEDKLALALNYESLVNKVTKLVENSSCYLIEKLGNEVLRLILKEKGVLSAIVRVDKPQAIAIARSVSFEISGKK